jgi:hypothetical protein
MTRHIQVLVVAAVAFAGCEKRAELGKTESHPLHAFKQRNDDPIAAAGDRYQRRLSSDGTVPPRALMTA